MSRPRFVYRYSMPILLLNGGFICIYWSQPSERAEAQSPMPVARFEKESVVQFVSQNCTNCHSEENKQAGLDLDAVLTEKVADHYETWEKVLRKLAARQMPPVGKPRPDEKSYETFIASLENELDRIAALKPNPGRTGTLRRLNRTEYENTIRDLLALDVNATALLPVDEANRGFDSAPLGDLSPTLMERFISAAQKISRLAVGRTGKSPSSDTFRVQPDVTQEGRVEGLPFGTRGGILIPYTFPQDGEYDVQVWLTRDRNENVEGLREPHELEVLIDRKKLTGFTVKPAAKGERDEDVDAKLKARIPISAGPHGLGVTFRINQSSLLEIKRQPYQAHFNLHRHPRQSPAIFQVTITGPYNVKGQGDTPSRSRIFISKPTNVDDEEVHARKILSALQRRAYRKPVIDAAVEKTMKFYRDGRKEGDFEAGIETALSAILVNPQFLYRVEKDPSGIAAKTAYRISDLDLASRLSFFLWSSIPDDELLDLAEKSELRKPDVFERQVRRLLADSRARNLAANFAGQWLHLRNLESITPDLRQFPDFDDNLRKSFRQETELFFESVLREDRSVLDLLNADYTFLNERLAHHYGIPHVYGERFRRVELGHDRQRGGLLRQGSILTVTSYATRTSPVIRGKWILENFLGTPPPPAPADVPSLQDNTVSANLPIRERLAEHRSNASCAGCHRLIDPVGFSLEQFDAVGRWRTLDEGNAVDAAGGLPDGSKFTGVSGLEKALLQRPELFVQTMIEKLITFALGRAPQESDASTIRKIVRDAKANQYRFSSILVGITSSELFQMRMSE